MSVVALTSEEYSAADLSFSHANLSRQLADRLREHELARIEVRVLLHRDNEPDAPVCGGMIVPYPSGKIVTAAWPIADTLVIEDQLLAAYAAMVAAMSPPRTATLLSDLDIVPRPHERRGSFDPFTEIVRYRKTGISSTSALKHESDIHCETRTPHDESLLELLKRTESGSQDLPEFLPLMEWRERLAEFESTNPRARLSLTCLMHSGSPVGVAVWSLDSVTREVEIDYLGIVPAARRRGRGQRLLEEVCGNARERGADAIELNVDNRNRAAIMLYEAAGFQEAFRRRLWISRDPGMFSTGSTHPASDAPVF